MGDVVSDLRKKTRSLQKPLEKAITKTIEKPVRTGASAKSREAAKQTLLQRQREEARMAETESEIQERRALARSSRAGRGSLIRTSGSGTARNLGGTA